MSFDVVDFLDTIICKQINKRKTINILKICIRIFDLNTNQLFKPSK